MTALQESRKIYVNETERRPNKYAANVLAGVVAVIATVCLLNETGVFQVSKELVRICLAVSFLQFLIMQFITHKDDLIIHPASKYIIMSMVLFLVLTITVLLNIHAVLAFVLPLLLATQYRSFRMSRLALIGSVFCCGIAPLLSYFLNTWSLLFMTGFTETFCKVKVFATPGNSISTGEALRQISLYWSLPQMMTLGAFGVILFSATKAGIDSVNNQMHVVDLSHDLSKQLDSISSMQEKVIFSMSDIIENRDIETGGHVKRTSEVVRLLMDAMRKDSKNDISEAFYNNVIKTAPMHDLGKIAIPDAILRKPDKLTAEEYEIVKQHPIRSAEIIARALTGIEDEELLTTAENIAKYHHERFDGKGYPEGLKGKEIPLEARIMAVADVYDALVNKRCYKAPMAYDEAYEAIESAMGTQFDPDLNEYFISCRKMIETYYQS